MKGKLVQTDGGWIIRYEDLLRLYPFSEYNTKEIHIHPHYEKYYFLDADADGSEVEFEIVTGDNDIRLAKLIRPEQAQELDMGYIGDDDTDDDKIDQILDRAMGGRDMKPLEKAQQLYTDAYTRWCYELSHDKNEGIAKSIAQYVCNEVLGYMGADRGYEFWCYVRDIVKHGGHSELYITKKP